MKFFSLVIPIYNEAKNIGQLIKDINKNIDLNNNEIVIIDDGSTDETQKVLTQYNSIKNLKIIKNSTNLGQSYSVREGVINSNHNIIVTMDGDGQNHPKDISKLINLYLNNESVYLVGGIRHKRRDSLLKILSSKIANNIRMFFLNDKCPDTGCSLKVFDKNIFLKFPYFDGMHRFLPALFVGFGYKTLFTDVSHFKRQYGSSKYGTFDRLFKGVRDIIIVKRILKRKNLYDN